jgi:hypothetical protein
MRGTAWEPWQLQYVKDHWGKRPAREIGNEIGRTRNAVIGQAFRLGLPDISGNFYGYHKRSPEGEARRLAAVKAKFQDPEWKARHSEACRQAQLRRFGKAA